MHGRLLPSGLDDKFIIKLTQKTISVLEGLVRTVGIGTVCEDDIDIVELESFQAFLRAFDDAMSYI